VRESERESVCVCVRERERVRERESEDAPEHSGPPAQALLIRPHEVITLLLYDPSSLLFLRTFTKTYSGLGLQIKNLRTYW